MKCPTCWSSLYRSSKLDDRGEFELVKTVFHLAKMEPADAEQEIGQLLGPGRSMVVMPKARQILVTETAGKLRTIRDVIERAENPTGAKDKGVTEFKLAYVSPEEVLLIARPCLGLDESENVGEEISIAHDTTRHAAVCHRQQGQDPNPGGPGPTRSTCRRKTFRRLPWCWSNLS